MAVKTARELFIDELRDIYNAEKQLLRALPKMARAATSPTLKSAFQGHLAETQQQVERLNQVFEALDMRASGKKCEAMEGLVEEAKSIMEDVEVAEVLDAALIAAAQKVEHYEIASYGALAALAAAIGENEAAALLRETLAEEKAADEKLTQIAESEVNPAMIGADGEEKAEPEAEDAGGAETSRAKAARPAAKPNARRPAASA